jgi:thioredoxin reductase (NADPH)
VTVFEDGRSRAALIPQTRNLAGYPEGIAGAELLSRMRRQAEMIGVRIITRRVESLTRVQQGFRLGMAGEEREAARVLVATGVSNLRPAMPDELHNEAVARGLLRYCPVCDGFEVSDRRIGLLGSGVHALREAQFMRSYSRSVTLVAPHGAHRFDSGGQAALGCWSIEAVDGPVTGIAIDGSGITLMLESRVIRFDTLYAALGTKVSSELARTAGARMAEDGGILVDRHQMTSVEGLYAAGDVVKGLDQIASAMGQAAIAATAMRNAICEAWPLRR